MNQIYYIQGKLHNINNTLLCHCQFENTEFYVCIPEDQRNNADPEDTVTVLFNPLTKWVDQNVQSVSGKSLVEISKYFNRDCLHDVMHNFNIVQSSLEVINLLKNRVQYQNMYVIPTGSVYHIVEKNPSRIQQIRKKVYEKLEATKPVDHTELITFTIDNANTILRDDALSFRVVDEKHIEIGVHCGNYVTKIDPEKMKRYGANNGQYSASDYGFKLGHCESFSLFVKIDVENKQITSLETGPSIVDVKATFSFESFTETVITGRLYEDRVSGNVDHNELISNCISIVQWLRYLGICSSNSNKSIGNDLINEIGIWIGQIAGISLKNTYNENAILKQRVDGLQVATFRSPLRKTRDRYVIRQLVALSVNMNDEEMMYYVGGCESKDEFRKLTFEFKRLKNGGASPVRRERKQKKRTKTQTPKQQTRSKQIIQVVEPKPSVIVLN